MPMTADQAKEWAFKNSKFLKLKDGESFTAKLKDMKPIQNRFNAEKEVIHYTFELPDGSIKYWDNGRADILDKLTACVGRNVQISREGSTANDTKYEATIAD